jgi:hypothetical protein
MFGFGGGRWCYLSWDNTQRGGTLPASRTQQLHSGCISPCFHFSPVPVSWKLASWRGATYKICVTSATTAALFPALGRLPQRRVCSSPFRVGVESARITSNIPNPGSQLVVSSTRRHMVWNMHKPGLSAKASRQVVPTCTPASPSRFSPSYLLMWARFHSISSPWAGTLATKQDATCL